MKTTNPFIAAQCDQSCEVCALDKLTVMTVAIGDCDADFAGSDELTDDDIFAACCEITLSSDKPMRQYDLEIARAVIAAGRALRKPSAVSADMPVVMHWVDGSPLVRQSDALAALAQKDAEIAEMRSNYEGACTLAAEMHTAAMGEITGPVLGVVEDVAALRKDAERYEYVLNCDLKAYEKYLPVMDVAKYKAALRKKHDAAIASTPPKE